MAQWVNGVYLMLISFLGGVALVYVTGVTNALPVDPRYKRGPVSDCGCRAGNG